MAFPQTPFKDRLNSFFCPDEAEIGLLHSLLPGPRAQLAQIEVDIANTTKALETLKQQRHTLRSYIFSHESLLAPIRRIPAHILQEIFVACLPTEQMAFFDHHEAPLLLGRVCRFWRQLSHETSLLWAGLLVCGDTRSPYYPRGRTPWTSQLFSSVIPPWLTRVGTRPLRISYIQHKTDIENSHHGNNPDDFRGTMLRTILDAHPRVGGLDIWCSSMDFWDSLLSLDPDNMPLLKHVRLISYPYAPPSVFDRTTLLRSPQLESVSLVGCADPLTLPLPWANLTDLRLKCHSIPSVTTVTTGVIVGGLDENGVYLILRRCTRLAHCELTITRLGSLTYSNPLTLPCMQELFLCPIALSRAESKRFHERVTTLLQLLAMPNLRAFGLGNSRAHELAPSSIIIPTAQVAEFHLDQVTEDAVLAALRELPPTTHLRVGKYFQNLPENHPWIWSLTDAFFETLEKEKLNAQLKHLHVVAPSSALKQSGFMSLLRFFSPDATHRTLTLSLPITKSLDVEDELRAEEQNGLRWRINVVCSDSEARRRRSAYQLTNNSEVSSYHQRAYQAPDD
ncbi:WD40 repeat-like protein [Mycena indigotica]|uniref:WD40 repeat-like protein n=1 Tax=Mycena indigotica TaxID=2126181 RepID=A0A8H6VYQ0_9AGAR|nr:WD40 repeat-like protein [Mycena indigotica]KAF7298697.1 WD40 repeat-like protein [Mycena indigotica]